MASFSEAIVEWQLETWAWLLTHLGGFEAFDEQTPLVLPDDEWFPVPADLEGHDLAHEIFRLVREHAGLDHWPCRLEVQDEPQISALLAGVPHQTESRGAAGTFSLAPDEEEVVITYHPGLVSDVTGLVATFAHELAHYVLATIPVDPPGTEEAEEYATDVAAVFLGFGVFTANAVFSFEQYQDAGWSGWRARRTGYLNEEDVAYALAIFTELLEIDPAEVRRHLDGNPRAYYKRALKDLRRRRGDDLQRLRAVGPADG